MKIKKISKSLISGIISLGITLSPSIRADEHNVLPEVTVVDTYVYWWNPTWYAPSFTTEYTVADGIYQFMDGYEDTIMEAQRLSQRSAAIARASVCVSALSSGARSTTMNSDVTSRWLAAQEVFNSMELQGSMWDWLNVIKNLTFLLRGFSYEGFIVYYADGSSETWAINPGYATSSVKLLDQPLPNSLEPKKPNYNRTCVPT